MYIIPFRKLKKFKVLVGTPHNEIKNYCLDDFLSNTTNLTYKKYDFLMVDNSKTNKNAKYISKKGIWTEWVDPRGRPNQEYIAESLEVIRSRAIRGNYDVLIILEDDIFPPLDFIERLLVHQQKVVSAPYFIREGSDSTLMVQELSENGISFKHTRNIPKGHDIRYANGKLHKIYAAGIGCIAIHKSIFSQIPFRYEKGLNAHPDSFFAADLQLKNISQYLDGSFICEHRNQSWANITDAYKGLKPV